MPMGFVSIVGAGPGDPELLTRRAAARLARADIVFYDALVGRGILALAPRAQCFAVGRRAGRPSIDRAGLYRLLIDAARRGRRVVRLKGGDPFVFGRGGEEAVALRLAGVPFEVVPGVTSAVAAPALAGIPVTHRGLASGFVVLSGHAESAFGPVIDGLPPTAMTLVVLMGVRTRAALAARLVARGWPATTPAALVLEASTPRQQVWIGTLRSLAEAPVPAGRDEEAPAGTVVVGSVVSLAGAIAGAVAGTDLSDGRRRAGIA